MNEEEEPFLKRWSRRKVEAKERPDAAEPEVAADADVRALDDRTAWRSSAPAQPGDRPSRKRSAS